MKISDTRRGKNVKVLYIKKIKNYKVQALKDYFKNLVGINNCMVDVLS